MAKDSPIQFKGTALKIIQAQVRTTDLAVLHAALADLTGNSPDFFENDLAVLDFSQAGDLPQTADWAAIRQLLRASGLHAAATLGLPDGLAAAAEAAGLPAISADALSRPSKARPAEAAPAPEPQPAPVVETPPPPAPLAAAPAEPPPRTITLDKPLRSGQRFYAKGCDLIVTAMVSAGAEVIADGNIHVYAPLRGRAIAGARGDTSARIFSTCMEPQLVSVAGIYRTTETELPDNVRGKPAQVRLDGEKLLIEPL